MDSPSWSNWVEVVALVMEELKLPLVKVTFDPGGVNIKWVYEEVNCEAGSYNFGEEEIDGTHASSKIFVLIFEFSEIA